MEGYFGEIRLFAGVDPPKNWALCDGSVLPVGPNTALFSLLGDTYGGDRRTMFALPDLRGRVIIGAGQGSLAPRPLGQTPGADRLATQLIKANLTDGPAADVNAPVSASGNNAQPVLALTYIICVRGIFPPRSDSFGSDGCVGEIRVLAGNFAPTSWALCDGSLLSITDPEDGETRRPLFDVIGYTYGGDGRTTFALPDLRGRAAVGVGQGPGLSSYDLGRTAGAEQIATEPIQANTGDETAVRSVVPSSDSNLQPALALNFVICMDGIFPRYENEPF